MITATERAHQINADRLARSRSDRLTLWSELVTDAAHWAECGVHTGEELDRLLAYEDYVETYKERYNIKPRWTRVEDHTAEEWQRMAADL